MTQQTLRKNLVVAHRWAALILSPILVAILLSGAVLAFRPILGAAPAPASPLPNATLAATLQRLDPQGQSASLAVDHTQQLITLKSRGPGPAGMFDAASGTASAKAAPFDIFAFALDLHRQLLVGLGFLVEAATWAMAGIVLVGLFLGLPKLSNTLMGWHMGLGWLALPLVAMLPLTGVLMILHVGGPQLPAPEPGPRLSLARAVQLAAQQQLPPVASARMFRGGTVLLTTVAGEGAPRYMISPSGRIDPITQGPGLVRELHEGTWGGAWSGALNFVGALGLSGLLGTGLWSWARRSGQARRRSGDRDAELLLAYASQTGNAARLAEATAAALRSAGARVACASLGALRPAQLADFREVLMIVSTTGEGELPDAARPFQAQLAGSRLGGVRFRLLALGDRRYAHFCVGGENLRKALLAAGAVEAAPWERVDGSPDRSWEDWARRQAEALGLHPATLAAAPGDQAVTLHLGTRTRLDDPTAGDSRETWALQFELEAPADFRPGDLLLIAPDADTAPRCYSIGSSSHCDGRTVNLTVSLHQWRDDTGASRFGHVSHWLCRELAEGASIQAALRPHPEFRPPADPRTPLILCAAGAGIAPFPGFLAERAGQDGRGEVWLFFGNRSRDADFLHRQRWEAWQREGVLTRLDTAFSRDAGGGYITERLRAAGPEVLDWLERGAVLYVCGRAATVGQGVEAALQDILRSQRGDSDPAATLAQWKAAGKLRLDIFG